MHPLIERELLAEPEVAREHGADRAARAIERHGAVAAAARGCRSRRSARARGRRPPRGRSARTRRRVDARRGSPRRTSRACARRAPRRPAAARGGAPRAATARPTGPSRARAPASPGRHWSTIRASRCACEDASAPARRAVRASPTAPVGVLDRLGEQRLAGGEVVVDERARDAGGHRDPRDPHVVDAVARDPLDRRGEDPLAGAGVAPARRAGASRRPAARAPALIARGPPARGRRARRPPPRARDSGPHS